MGERVYVLAFQPGTTAPIEQTETFQEANFGYNLSSLPPGDYILYAGTDRDGDGFICDVGDLCGAMPTVAAPLPLSVAAGSRLIDKDIPMAEVVTGAGATVPPLHLPRMR